MYGRTLETTVITMSKLFPIVLITGPRQVGKTTLLEICSDQNRSYVTLDNLEARYLAQNDPELFMQTYPAPAIIDEIQYAPQLFTYIKIYVDKKRKNGMYWITGSQKFELMKGVSESLAGRVAILDLLGLSYNEQIQSPKSSTPFIPTRSWINQHRKLKESHNGTPSVIYKRIWQGSYPGIVKGNAQARDIFYRSYIQTYIQRDIKDILKISDSMVFLNFVTALAARTGQELNYSSVSKDIGIDSKTVKSWVSVLQTSGLIYLLQPYSTNLKKRLVKTPKIYFLDTGLCSYLTGWSSPKAIESGVMSGSLLETYIFSEIIKSYWHNGLRPNIYYYRDSNQKEIDLVIEQDNTLYPIQFKKTATPSLSATKSFDVLNIYGKTLGEGAVVCFISQITPLSTAITAIPIHAI